MENLLARREYLLSYNCKNNKSTKIHIGKELDKVNIQIEKLEYNQLNVIKALREAGLSASKKQTTSIRGYNTYTKGYEVDNKYSVSFIAVHSINENDVDRVTKIFIKNNVKATISTNGIVLRKE